MSSPTPHRFVDVCLLSGQAPQFTYLNPQDTLCLGDLVRVPFGRGQTLAIVWEVHDRAPIGFEAKPIVERALDTGFAPAHLLALCQWISQYYLCPPGVAIGPMVSSAGKSSLNRLGLGKRKPKHTATRADIPLSVVMPARNGFVLTQDQNVAVQQLNAAVAAQQFSPFLLHGITGSGKTAVFLEAARTALEMGKQVLFLVPEIGLTPQTVRRVRDCLGDQVALLHSQLTDTERADYWTRLRSGELRVALGPRSALFAPLFDLGLIIVDEEHDGSYKQNGDAPRYHGRDAAVWLAKQCGIPVVMGSATPSLESWQNARDGRYTLLSLTERATGATLPTVQRIDLRKSRPATASSLSGELRQLLSETLQRGERAMVLHNRRGYAPLMECLECGHTPECPECTGMRMTYHRSRKRLICHHCGLFQDIPTVCPECGSDALDPEGWAIQRVEEELQRAFPETSVVRLDRDVAAHRGEQERVLDDFGRDGGILLGTQMIAKGHDFATVTLAAVTDADIGAAMPDFRASERSFQLLSQLAGRAGRGALAGRVVLQTRRPDDPLLEQVAHHDFLGFANEELEKRRQLHLPPFAKLVLLEASSEEEIAALHWMRGIAERLKAPLQSAAGYALGPIPAPLPVVRKRYRFHLLCKCAPPRASLLRQILGETCAHFPPPRNVRYFLDVDPVDLI